MVRRLFVQDGLTIAAIAAKTAVPERTLYRWSKKERWERDREMYAASSLGLDADLVQAQSLMRAQLRSEDPDKVKEAADYLDKITKIRERIGDRAEDRMPIALDLIDSLVDFARQDIPESHKEPLIDLLRRWADHVRRNYREAQK